jgi:hypothetical protein
MKGSIQFLGPSSSSNAIVSPLGLLATSVVFDLIGLATVADALSRLLVEHALAHEFAQSMLYSGRRDSLRTVASPTVEKSSVLALTLLRRAVAANQSWRVDVSDRGDFENVRCGFIATLPDGHIDADSGGVAWRMKPYGVLAGESPDTINPNLWRTSQLNAVHGLFAVNEGV